MWSIITSQSGAERALTRVFCFADWSVAPSVAPFTTLPLKHFAGPKPGTWRARPLLRRRRTATC